MASADLLKKIFKSYKQRDDNAFFAAALEIIAEEKRKNHNILARDLQRILENGDIRPLHSTHIQDFQKLPRDREKETVLLEIRSHEQYLSDIILSEKLSNQVEKIIEEYRSSSLIKTYGLKPRLKLLFAGPPGCGKTLCAEILTGELGLPMLYTRFDAVISSYLGETAANLRKVFDYAERGRWVVFFDEFDAIGKSRNDFEEHGELKRVVNTFLQLLDNFQSESIFIAATNHEILLDKALWRRFDDILFFDIPNDEQICKLLKLKLKGFNHKSLNIEKFIGQMSGWSHADIERVCIEAIKLSILASEDEVKEDKFMQAIQLQGDRAELIKRTRK